MMIPKNTIYITCLAVLLALLVLGDNASAMSTVPGIYHFTGRVMNQEDKPVGRCGVLLVKRMVQKDGEQKAEQGQAEGKQYVTISEEVVATTDADGNYAFVFEPLTADNFWVFFSADGYRTRPVELDPLMRSRFFRNPNRSPINLDVVLEKN